MTKGGAEAPPACLSPDLALDSAGTAHAYRLHATKVVGKKPAVAVR